jgi:cellulose synthase/poly-beta-1,6-N-acetylglucosamine synthase-like glycosyltransferase
MVPPLAPTPPLTAADVTIVVPVGGAAPAWARAAMSLGRLNPPPGEVVAVIDGPDATLAATAAAIGATVLVLDARGGPARARNRGARAAGRPILLFVDADVEVPGDLAARVAKHFAAHPEVVALFGSYDATPAAAGLVSQYRNLQHHFVHQTACETASTFWAGCGAVRREAFEQVGGFDEAYDEPSIEDIELGVRLVATGRTIRLVKDLQVTHLKRWRLADMLTTDLWRRAVPWSALMFRDRRLLNDLNVKTRDRLSVVLAFVALLALAAGWHSRLWLGVCVVALALVVVLNGAFFRFLRGQRGGAFALGAVPLYWLYLLVCGLGVGLGLVRHLTARQG